MDTQKPATAEELKEEAKKVRDELDRLRADFDVFLQEVAKERLNER
jgi:hypothetical protein